MTITTYEGVVEKGQIRIKDSVHLPDNTKVYVVVPETKAKKSARVMSPRLVHHKQVADFRMEVSEDNSNASLRR
ncbi:MAG: hypothetical protein NTW99_12245 [Chloroflexi bacterium]|jgi:hypothetical protein|nr:hypothetical protein [Chloroflexota bacterium]